MSDSISVTEAKAKLSHLIDRAAGGEEIVIARSGKPIARLVALADPPKRQFGMAKHWKMPSDDVLFAPMSEEDIRWATGYYQKDNDLYYTKADLARLRKQGLYGPPPKAKKKRARKPC
jgi:prevent-host-death family protein